MHACGPNVQNSVSVACKTCKICTVLLYRTFILLSSCRWRLQHSFKDLQPHHQPGQRLSLYRRHLSERRLPSHTPTLRFRPLPRYRPRPVARYMLLLEGSRRPLSRYNILMQWRLLVLRHWCAIHSVRSWHQVRRNTWRLQLCNQRGL